MIDSMYVSQRKPGFPMRKRRKFEVMNKSEITKKKLGIPKEKKNLSLIPLKYNKVHNKQLAKSV